MNPLKACVINELERMAKKKKLIVFTVLNILVCSIYFILNIGGFLARFNLSSGTLPLTLLSVYVQSILPFYIFMESMELFSAEYISGSIKTVLIRPITRFKIYLAKVITLAIFICVNLLMLLVLSLIANIGRPVNVGDIVVSYMVSVVPMVCLSMVTALIAQVFRNGLLGMLVCIVTFLIAWGAKLFFSRAAAFLFTSYLTWYNSFIVSSMNPMRVFNVFLLFLSTMVLSFVLGYTLFDNKEF